MMAYHGDDLPHFRKGGNSVLVDSGYYLLVDKGHGGDGSTAEGEGLSLYLVQIVGDMTVAPKKGHTTSDKKVMDDDNATGNDWQDSADYDIGDVVPFRLSAIVADDYTNYTNGYKLVFHDKKSNGLTFNKSSVVVKVAGETLTNPANAAPYYEVVTEGLDDDCTFEVRFPNLRKISTVSNGTLIEVFYNSTLNEDAVIGQGTDPLNQGNPNVSYITYTNNPYDEQFSDNGSTPEDKVTVFTYELIVNKFANQDTTTLWTMWRP